MKYKLEESVKGKKKTIEKKKGEYNIYKLPCTEADNSWKGILTNSVLASYMSEGPRFSP